MNLINATNISIEGCSMKARYPSDAGYLETDDGAPITAHLIPAMDYVSADWEGGTLARVTKERRDFRTLFFVVVALTALAASVVL